MKLMQLELWQATFAAALMDANAAAASLPAVMCADDRAMERVGLYRSNVCAARGKALVNAFPVVRALVGNDFFAALARAYGRACPSASGDLNEFGAGLAEFIAGFEHTRRLQYLRDVAALEWAVHCAHHAADSEAIVRDQIATMSPQEMLSARFVLHPACVWFESCFPIASIWRAHQLQAAAALPDSLDRSEYALVARPHWRVEVAESSAAELAALGRLQAGGDMSSAIAVALAKDARFDFAAALVRWLDLAVLVNAPAQPAENQS